jgi:hypothetical protein
MQYETVSWIDSQVESGVDSADDDESDDDDEYSHSCMNLGS